ncbi:MAG TPA: hypothetical protein PK156_45650, partial [Polyangium sp.]|nr:hypothetical protein [Polyangium sp.]
MKLFSICLVAVIALGCGSERKNESRDASNTPSLNASANIRQRTNTDPSPAIPQRALGTDEVRVSLLVLPGDAPVEVDKVPARRRNGMVELVGHVGDEVLVNVILGANTNVERAVKIEAMGTSPALIDAEE